MQPVQPPAPHAAFLRAAGDGRVASRNERDLLDLVRRHGALSRADLVRATGLAAQSVMRLVDDLVARGLLRLGEVLPRGGRGKPSLAVQIQPGYACTVGVSVTTDSIDMALVDFSGTVLMQKHVATGGALGTDDLVSVVSKTTGLLLRTHRVEPSRLFGIGVGITGFFVGEGLRVNPPAPLDGLALIDLAELLTAQCGHPVWLDNDGTVAAAGESLLGVGRWAPSFGYLYFGHGLGGGIVVDGECVRGAHGNAGELAGMLPMLGMERPTLELLREMLGEDGVAFADIDAMLAAFNPHWPACDRWVARAQPALSLIVSALVALLDPDAIVFGGRLPRALAERAIAAISIDNLPRRGRKRPEPRLVPAEAPDNATAIGAALLPLKDCVFK